MRHLRFRPGDHVLVVDGTVRAGGRLSGSEGAVAGLLDRSELRALDGVLLTAPLAAAISTILTVPERRAVHVGVKVVFRSA